MIRQSTIDKLHDLRLYAMSDAFESQCADPDTYTGDYPLKTALECWSTRNGPREKVLNCKSLSAVQNSGILMRAWKI